MVYIQNVNFYCMYKQKYNVNDYQCVLRGLFEACVFVQNS